MLATPCDLPMVVRIPCGLVRIRIPDLHDAVVACLSGCALAGFRMFGGIFRLIWEWIGALCTWFRTLGGASGDYGWLCIVIVCPHAYLSRFERIGPDR